MKLFAPLISEHLQSPATGKRWSTWICLCRTFHINGIIPLCVWFLSCGVIFLPCHSAWFFTPFYGAMIFCGMDRLCLVCLCLGWWVWGLFPPVAVMSMLLWTLVCGVYVDVCAHLSWVPRSGIAGTCVNSIFNCLKDCHIALQSSCTVLWSHEQCVRFPVFSHPHQHLLLSAFRAPLVAQTVKHLPAMLETLVWPLGGKDPLEKEMATYSSILSCKIPWMEEPGRLQSMGLQRVGHDWATSLLIIAIQS